MVKVALAEAEEATVGAVVEEARGTLVPIISKHHHPHLHHQTYYHMAIQNIGHPMQLRH